MSTSAANLGRNWAITHVNGNSAGVTELVGAPALGQSHYIKGIVMSGGANADSIQFLRRRCLKFTALNNTLTVADGATLQMAAGDFSVELWFRWVTGTVAAVAGLLSKKGATEGYLFSISSAGKPVFTVADSDESVVLTGPASVCDDRWHHLCATVDRSEAAGFILYVDGYAVASGDPTAIEGNVSAAGTNLIATGIANVTLHVANIGIYKALALSAATVLANMNRDSRAYNAPGFGKKLTGSETSITCALPLDEGTGSTCYDMTANNNDGTVANAGWAEDGLTFEAATQMNVGPIHCGNVTGAAYDLAPRVISFPDFGIRIAEQCPVRILETDGSFVLILMGETR